MKKNLFLLTIVFWFSFSLFANENVQNFKLLVTDKGFEPKELKVRPDVPVVLHVTRKTNATCAREIAMPTKKIKVELPLNKEVAINLGKLGKGEIKFGCSMEMMVGGVMFIQ